MLNLQIKPGNLQGDLVPQQADPASPGGQPSKQLFPGHSWYSPSGSFRLTFQSTDHNLVWQVINDATLPPWQHGQSLDPDTLNWLPVWSPHIQGQSATQVDMQIDGNLVAYAGTTPVFNTKTNGNEHAFLRPQDDGNLVIYNAAGHAIFATNTSALEAPGHNT